MLIDGNETQDRLLWKTFHAHLKVYFLWTYSLHLYRNFIIKQIIIILMRQRHLDISKSGVNHDEDNNLFSSILKSLGKHFLATQSSRWDLQLLSEICTWWKNSLALFCREGILVGYLSSNLFIAELPAITFSLTEVPALSINLDTSSLLSLFTDCPLTWIIISPGDIPASYDGDFFTTFSIWTGFEPLNVKP